VKHQYFGDVNDYRKYGLLRKLQSHSGLRLGVCWMLTADDGRNDGNFTSYLAQPGKWRPHDPELFDHLVTAISTGRHLDRVREHNLLPGATFVDALVPDGRRERHAFAAAALNRLADAELIFFDPDNGLEISSCAIGRKGSSKYLMWSEVADAYAKGKSILIYQHFRREERGAFISRIANELRATTACHSVLCFRTAHVAFFLVIQPLHSALLNAAAMHVEASWAGQIECSQPSSLAMPENKCPH